MPAHDLTQQRLREILNYDPETGVFTWLVSPHGRVKPGDTAGTPSTNRYISITINRHHYGAHRLAFFYQTGVWPPNSVDHIDGNRINNSWGNLRHATKAQNAANTSVSSRNKVGLKGVCFAAGKYRASITRAQKTSYLGSFDTPEEAHAAYMRAATELFGAYARAA